MFPCQIRSLFSSQHLQTDLKDSPLTMDTKDATNERSRKNEREEDSFSDDDVAVHSVRFKRKKIDAGGQGQASAGGGASDNGVTAASGAGTTAGKGSGLYLDTIRRYMLDFDFEKVCSVSLSNLNVYACLVCGKYFQGMCLAPLHTDELALSWLETLDEKRVNNAILTISKILFLSPISCSLDDGTDTYQDAGQHPMLTFTVCTKTIMCTLIWTPWRSMFCQTRTKSPTAHWMISR